MWKNLGIKCRKCVKAFLGACDFFVPESKIHNPMINLGDIGVAVVLLIMNLILLWSGGAECAAIFLNLLNVLHILFMNLVSRKDYLESYKDNKMAYMRIIITESAVFLLSLWQTILVLTISDPLELANHSKLIVSICIIAVFLDTLRVDLTNMVDAHPQNPKP